MKKIEIIDIDESFTHIKINGDIAYAKIIMETLSAFEEGYQFSPAFRFHGWDGKKYFFKTLPDQILEIPKGLINYVIKDLKNRKKEYTYKKLEDTTKITKEDFNTFIKSLNTPFMPYDYQEEAALDSINEKRLVLASATGCLDPKSLINVEVSLSDLEFLKNNFR